MTLAERALKGYWRKLVWWAHAMETTIGIRVPCCHCGSLLGRHVFTLEHVLPVSKGGGNSIGNLLPACADCNSRNGATDNTERFAFKFTLAFIGITPRQMGQRRF